VCNCLKDNLPRNDLFLKKVSVISPQKFIQSGAIDNLKVLMASWPIIIPNGSSQDDVINQLNSLQIELMEKETLPSACEDVCEFWSKLAKQGDHKTACLLIIGLLVVPHSSASYDRVFSCFRKIKQDQRSLMGDALLEALIVTKLFSGSAVTRKFPPELLKYLKGSCSRHIT
jgi:hypothetical protein